MSPLNFILIKRPMESRSNPPRKPRADGQRNRELIIQTAKEAFTQNGAGASLDDIAKRASVGAGTLYRHFPTRESLLEAVYRSEVEKLGLAAERLAEELPPVEALRAWLLLFVDHLATKKIIAAALQNLVGGCGVFEENAPKMWAAVQSLFDRAVKAGEMNPEVNPADFLRAIVGVTFFGASENWKDSAIRLVDVLILGSRPK